MNQDTIKAITGVLGMINPALGVIGAFASSFGASGTAVAKVTDAVKSAANVVGALTPFIEKIGREEDFTLDDARTALEGDDAAVAEFDKLIAEKS